MNPKYPVYIVSKGRWKQRLTANAFEKMGVPYRMVVEEEQYEEYTYLHNINPRRFSVASFQSIYSDFSHGFEKLKNISNQTFAPHQDVSITNWSQKLWASTVWLNKPEECNGGTAFFKWKKYDTQSLLIKDATNLFVNIPGNYESWEEMMSLKSFKQEFEKWDKRYPEDIYSAEAKEYLLQLNKDFKSSKNDYIDYRNFWTNLDEIINNRCGTSASDEWEIVDVTPMKYNRLLIYQGIYFHSQYIKDDWFADYPRIQMQHFF